MSIISKLLSILNLLNMFFILYYIIKNIFNKLYNFSKKKRNADIGKFCTGFENISITLEPLLWNYKYKSFSSKKFWKTID